jgi:hypothetical protein
VLSQRDSTTKLKPEEQAEDHLEEQVQFQ